MNNKVIIGIIVLIVVVGGILLLKGQYDRMQQQPTAQNGSATAMAKNVVAIQNMTFSPATLTVKAGDKVTWTNQDSVEHSATADDNSFDTGVLFTGKSGSITFSKAGTYTYHCSVHPNMKAKIIVTQ